MAATATTDAPGATGTASASMTRRLIELALGTSGGELPKAVKSHVRARLTDGIAVALAARDAEGIAPLTALASEWGGAAQAGILGSDLSLPAPLAALVNGAMMHALDFDDTHAKAIVHPGTVVIPAALAASQCAPETTGEDFVAAIAIGSEVMCRLGLAFPGEEKTRSGWHFTPLLGHLAATIAAARIFRLSEDQAQQALGIAYHQAAGNMQGLVDGALTKRIGPGFAAHNALVAVAMARCGISGARESLDGRFGLFRQFGGANGDEAKLLDGFGSHYESLDIFVKPYPCCALNYPFIRAALGLRDKLAGDTGKVTKFVAHHGPAADLVCSPIEVRRNPANVVDAQFSACWAIAAAMASGDVQPRDYSEAGLTDPELRRLADMVELRADPALEGNGELEPVELDALLDDGTVVRSRSEEFSVEEGAGECALRKIEPLPNGRAIWDAIEDLSDRGSLRRFHALIFS